ncbi:MAG: hypothetical protein H6822_33195 [Planctomycetaceae bacterium]|nr:hypothetical protein [Planctomycetales bacterium]MCB9927043.1 hypothetical protein [Planctomycetaceae bacterium]
MKAQDIAFVTIVIDEGLHKVLQRQGTNLERYALQMAEQLAGSHWDVIQRWIQSTGNSISIAMMGGKWNAARIGEVVVNAFGHTPHIRPGAAMQTASAQVGSHNIGIAVCMK